MRRFQKPNSAYSGCDVTRLRRAVKWVGATAAGLVIAVVVLIVVSPKMRLMAVVIVSFLFADQTPPPIAKGIVLRQWFADFGGADAELTAALERIGLGANEDTFRSSLVAQGFKPLPPPPADCLPAEQQHPVGKVHVPCYSTKNILRYEWNGNLVCLDTIAVTWRTNERREITEVKGSYSIACL